MNSSAIKDIASVSRKDAAITDQLASHAEELNGLVPHPFKL
ncbi:hypothetical protein [Virgibacillus halodenitrificans]|nr:hypothetical protein [Virgibacillus halodenitrificans]